MLFLVFVIGLNYWPRYMPIYFWSDYREDEILEDLNIIKELGVNSLRIFLLTKIFLDRDCSVKEEKLDLLRDFLDKSHRYGLRIYLTLLVGHMSGMNFNITEKSIYDEESIACIEKFVYQLASKIKDRPALEAYVLSNEITIYEKPPSRDKYRHFLRRLYNAIRKADPIHKITSGSGLFYPWHIGAEPETEAEIIDYLSSHMYNYDCDIMRQSLAYIFKLKHSISTGKPVIYEEIGYSSYQYGDIGQYLFLRAITYSILANGAHGLMIWCFSDFNKEEQLPYSNHPYELGFGIIRSDGTLKPAANIVKELVSLDKEYGLSEYKPKEDPIGILVPKYMYDDIPFINTIIEKIDKATTIKILHQSFTMLKMAGYNPIVVNEDNFDKRNIRVIIIPSIPILRAITWRKLLELVKNGLTLYYSGAISLKDPHHAPTHLWRELFGVLPIQTPGYIAPILDDIVLELDGSKIIIPGLKGQPKYTVHIGVKVRPIDAEVIVENDDEPLILRKKIGSGEAILVTKPIEYQLIEVTDVNTNYKPYIVYKHLLSHKIMPIRQHNPVVEVISVFKRSDELTYFINHSYSEACIGDLEGEPIIMHGTKKDYGYIIEPRGVVLVAKK